MTEQQPLTALRRRAPVEQMLSENLDAGSFSWIEARSSGQGFALRLHHTLDNGSENFLDVYEFRSVDENDYLGEGVLVGAHHDEASLLQAAVEVGAQMDRWVNEGVIQDEYRDLRARR